MAEDNGLSRSPVVEINTRCPLVPKLTISRSFLPLSGHRTTVAQPAAPVRSLAFGMPFRTSALRVVRIQPV